MKISTITVIFISVLFFATNMTLAADVGYEVEIIIFEDIKGTYKNSEKWPEPNIETIEIKNTDIKKIDIKIGAEIKSNGDQSAVNIELNDIEPVDIEINNGEPPLFENIEQEYYRLSAQAEKIKNHPDYRILLHKAWKQPGLDNDDAIPIEIKTAINTDDINNTGNTVQSYIDGEMTLVMTRYLHMITNLVFHKPVYSLSTDSININGNTHNSFNLYTIKSERRMRSKEIHYIDHPLVGIIVLAIPFKIEPDVDPEIKLQDDSYKTLSD